MSKLYDGVFVDLIRRSIMKVKSSPQRWKDPSLRMANGNRKSRGILRRSFRKSRCRAIARDATMFLVYGHNYGLTCGRIQGRQKMLLRGLLMCEPGRLS